jgi:hypothetical protein
LRLFVCADVLKLGANAGAGIAKKIPDLIPTPENLYSISKQTLIGLPFELLLSGIDKLCEYPSQYLRRANEAS